MESLTQTSVLFAQRLEEVEDDMRRLTEMRVSELDAIYDDNVPIERRLKLLGEEITATLLSQDYRGGYPVVTSFSRFLQDFENDSGINLDIIAGKLRFKDAKKLILSESMKPYIRIDLNDDGKETLRGRPFESDLLKEIIVDQTAGFEAEKRAENEKQAESLGRIRLNKSDPKAIDGRLKIYSCLYALAGDNGNASYQSVQTEYQEKFGVTLNKAELKKYFGTGEAKTVLMMDCDGDIHVHIDHNLSGMMHLKFAKPYAEIVKHYERAVKIANEMPEAAAVVAERTQIKQEVSKQIKSKRYGSISSQKKVPVQVPVEFPMDLDTPWTKSGAAALIDDEVLPFAPKVVPTGGNMQPLGNAENRNKPLPNNNSMKLPQPQASRTFAPISSQPRNPLKKTHTERGEGVFSDDDDSDEDEAQEPEGVPQPMSQQLPHPPIVGELPPEPNVRPLFRVSVLANPAEDTLDLDGLDETIVSGGGAPNLFRTDDSRAPNPFRNGSESGASSVPPSSSSSVSVGRSAQPPPQFAPTDRFAKPADPRGQRFGSEGANNMGHSQQPPVNGQQMFKLVKHSADVQPMKPVMRPLTQNPPPSQRQVPQNGPGPSNARPPSNSSSLSSTVGSHQPPLTQFAANKPRQQPSPSQGPFVSHKDQIGRRLPNVEPLKAPSEEMLHACIHMYLAADKGLLHPIKTVAKEVGQYLRSRGYEITTSDIFYHITRELKSEFYFTNNAYVSLPSNN